MPANRSHTFDRRALKEAIAFTVATAGVVAIGASSAAALADDHLPNRAALVSQHAPKSASAPAGTATATPIAAKTPAPAQAPAPAPGNPPAPAQWPAPPAPANNPAPAPAPAPAPSYPNDLDGWIRQALDIMHANGIPGTYDGIQRNIARESEGNPQAVNLWDVNALAGVPSKGLLQVIDPTFAAYHVPGTSNNIWDPVANIAAACNYA
ncbi:MAG: transglycosylase SLT domain-containing protein, partial [Mycobacterium sp.]|nr:transglycosylase SLT domain-containing protein [Mycobacterium sp.]